MVAPQALHLRQVPFRAIWLLPHSTQMSPVKPSSMAAWRSFIAERSDWKAGDSRVI